MSNATLGCVRGSVFQFLSTGRFLAGSGARGRDILIPRGPTPLSQIPVILSFSVCPGFAVHCPGITEILLFCRHETLHGLCEASGGWANSFRGYILSPYSDFPPSFSSLRFLSRLFLAFNRSSIVSGYLAPSTRRMQHFLFSVFYVFN